MLPSLSGFVRAWHLQLHKLMKYNHHLVYFLLQSIHLRLVLWKLQIDKLLLKLISELLNPNFSINFVNNFGVYNVYFRLLNNNLWCASTTHYSFLLHEQFGLKLLGFVFDH